MDKLSELICSLYLIII